MHARNALRLIQRKAMTMNRKWMAAVVIGMFFLGGSAILGIDYDTIEGAKQRFFPTENSRYESVDLAALRPEQKNQISRQARVSLHPDRCRAWQVYDNNHTIGWFYVDNVIGKHDFITYAAAISPSGNVIGVSVLTYRETHGEEVAHKSWLDKLTGKTYRDAFKIDDDIDGISGATLSVRNMSDGVRKLAVMSQVLSDK